MQQVRVVSCAFVIMAMAAASEGATLRVCASGCSYTSLQAAVDAAQPGDTIMLRAGETFVGHTTLRRKTGTSTILIRSDAADTDLPAAGVRLVPSTRGGTVPLSKLARLKGKGANWQSTPVIQTEAGAHNYLLQFLDIDGIAQSGYGTLVSFGSSAQTSSADAPSSITVDRVYVHGDPVKGIKRCLALNSASTSVINSYFADCKHFASDSQAIAGWNGPGPFTIENNYLEGSTENILFGGADPKISNLVPSDIVIRRNHITKPLSWRNTVLKAPTSPAVASSTASGSLAAGTHYFKVQAVLASGGSWAFGPVSPEVSISLSSSGRAVTVTWAAVAGATTYRVYRGTSAGGENRWAETTTATTSLTYTGSSEQSASPKAPTYWTVKNLVELKNAQRVTIEGNVVENVWKAAQTGFAFLLTPKNQENTAPWTVVRDVTIRDNTVRHVNGGVNILGRDYSSSTGSQLAQHLTITNNVFTDVGFTWGGGAQWILMSRGPAYVTIEHNTVVHTGHVVFIDNGTSSSFVFRNNMSMHNQYGIAGSGAGFGNSAIKAYFPGGIVTKNVLAGGDSTLYPAGNYFPSVATWQAQFVNYAGGDYRLVSTSTYNNVGSDGLDLGANIDTLTSVQSGATSNAASDPAPTPSEPAPTTPPGEDIVLTAADVTTIGTAWAKVPSSGSPDGQAMASTEQGWWKTDAPLAKPDRYFEASFIPQAKTLYRVWLRLSAASTSDDSVWVQFTGGSDSNGAPLWRTGTTSALLVNLEACSGCGVSGWGWQGGAWWITNTPLVRFASAAPQTIRVQTREDGVRIDQIVLSPVAYVTNAPGAPSTDGTVLARTAATLTAGKVVLRAVDAVALAGNWAVEADSTAADGTRLGTAERGWWNTQSALAAPPNYVELTFTAIAGVPYRTWLRMSAYGNSASNDSVWVQYSGSLVGGQAAWRIGTTSGLAVNREACGGCGLSGWGWQDSAWWTGQTGTITFATTGVQTIRIQTREDGVRVDQVVVSPDTYLSTAPGAKDNDTTIVLR